MGNFVAHSFILRHAGVDWLFTLATIPETFNIYRIAPVGHLGRLVTFGLGWGLGAVLFGLGMERLALGYPIIMWLIATLGALLPDAQSFPQTLVSPKGALIVPGTAPVFVWDSALFASRSAQSRNWSGTTHGSGACGNRRRRSGSSALLDEHRHDLRNLRGSHLAGTLCAGEEGRQSGVGAVLPSGIRHPRCVLSLPGVSPPNGPLDYWSRLAEKSLLIQHDGTPWIGSFSGHCIRAKRLGPFGAVTGRPPAIKCLIRAGNVVGLRRGEWQSTALAATALLTPGLMVLLSAAGLIAVSGALP